MMFENLLHPLNEHNLPYPDTIHLYEVSWLNGLKSIEKILDDFHRGIMHPRGEVPLQVMANQCGICRFGDDPQTSVLDRDYRAYDLDNLYVVDGSFFPSNAAVSPALTIIANALRVGDRLIEYLK
jgi:choline dehydrogenase-like flavoprotein